MRGFWACSLVALGTFSHAEPANPIRLDQMSYADVVTEIRGKKGQVVLVDIWGTFCAPCKEKFPGIVALHVKHAKSGLEVISVSVDTPGDADARQAAEAFLVRQKAAFRNVQLTDKAEVWQAKWKVDGPPLLFLFGRNGELIARWDGKTDLVDVERAIVAALAK